MRLCVSPPSGVADRSLHCKIRSWVCVQSNRLCPFASGVEVSKPYMSAVGELFEDRRCFCLASAHISGFVNFTGAGFDCAIGGQWSPTKQQTALRLWRSPAVRFSLVGAWVRSCAVSVRGALAPCRCVVWRSSVLGARGGRGLPVKEPGLIALWQGDQRCGRSVGSRMDCGWLSGLERGARCAQH